MSWWDNDPAENVYLEITARSDVGADLLAPNTARGGVQTPGYSLVALVGRGDIVVHYSSTVEAIVGVSKAVGGPEPAQILWAARGSYARRAGTEPRMLPGLQVPIDSFTALQPPLSLPEIRAAGERLMEIRQAIHESQRGPIYFPFVPYGEGPIRPAQTYLAKLPQAAISLFPRLREAVTIQEESGPALESDDVELAEKTLADLAGKRRPRRGQGFQMNQEVKVAVEARAMDLAMTYFRGLGEVRDVHSNQSFDLSCTIEETEWHVEVKGTTTTGDSVLLTPLEVKHARTLPNVCLFVVSEIDVAELDGGAIEASGGTPWLLNPWDIDAMGKLTPIGFSYAISPGARQPPPI